MYFLYIENMPSSAQNSAGVRPFFLPFLSLFDRICLVWDFYLLHWSVPLAE